MHDTLVGRKCGSREHAHNDHRHHQFEQCEAAHQSASSRRQKLRRSVESNEQPGRLCPATTHTNRPDLLSASPTNVTAESAGEDIAFKSRSSACNEPSTAEMDAAFTVVTAGDVGALQPGSADAPVVV